LPFDAVNPAGAERRIRAAAANRSPCFLSTPNLNFLIACRSDTAFRDSVIDSDLSIADGMPLIWTARLLGVPIRERVAGSGLVEQMRKGTSSRLAIYFFGGMEGVAEAACRRLNAEPSGLTCVGYETPGFGSIEDMSGYATIAKINASGADFLLVSLGARKGQAWIQHNRGRISVPVISHLGAALNFVAGTVNRAPAWMQNIGLEWLWRIKEEPMLWRRYLGDGLALIALLLTRVLPLAWYLRWHEPDASEVASAGMEARESGQDYTICLRGPWTLSNLAPLRDGFSKAVQAEKDIKLEMEDVRYVDCAFVGLVMLLQGHQARHGRKLLVGTLQRPARRAFKYSCAEYLLLRNA
jgi:N-acetylglucosaminyldiphosphoundecaprenol N-acetyl-beta-D-mannosaminyltransferase